MRIFAAENQTTSDNPIHTSNTMSRITKSTPLRLALGTLATAGLALSGCAETRTYTTPQFEEFTYEGHDARYDVAWNPETQFLNPILSGCTPDPAITRKGEDYYLANSSFVYYPGIPIWHSRDLVNWDLVGYALDRPEQLMLKDGLRISAGIYAPDIKYNEANDTFYLIVTGVGCGGNFIVKTKDPAAGWSDPIPVPEVGGIDPSFLFDTDGKAYIVNNDNPAYPAEYDGHRAIWIREFDTETDRVVGEAKVLVDKGVRPEEKPIWVEGPHLYHIGDTYYVMTAEGGTADWHSEVVFSSSSPWGPFKPCPVNPILTQRTLPADRPFPITCAGHADLFQTPEGEWWAIFLAVNTYDGRDRHGNMVKDRFSNTGRSTFLLPARWEGGQPIILDNGATVPTVVDRPKTATAQPAVSRPLQTGNGKVTDDFEEAELAKEWFTLRTPLESWYALRDGALQITPRPVRLNEEKQPSMICRWVKNDTFTASTVLNFTPQGDKTLAGLTVFQNERAHYVIGKTCDTASGQPCVVLLRTDHAAGPHPQAGEGITDVVAMQPLSAAEANQPLTLRIEARGEDYTFWYGTQDGKLRQLGDVQDGKILSTAVAGGFTGAVIGLYATTAAE